MELNKCERLQTTLSREVKNGTSFRNTLTTLCCISCMSHAQMFYTSASQRDTHGSNNSNSFSTNMAVSLMSISTSAVHGEWSTPELNYVRISGPVFNVCMPSVVVVSFLKFGSTWSDWRFNVPASQRELAECLWDRSHSPSSMAPSSSCHLDRMNDVCAT